MKNFRNFQRLAPSPKNLINKSAVLYILGALTLLLLPKATKCQTQDVYKNAIYANLLGESVAAFSLHYERLYWSKKNPSFMSVNVGVSPMPYICISCGTASYSAGVSYNDRINRSNYYEIGLGYGLRKHNIFHYSQFSTIKKYHYLMGRIGIRYQPPNGRLLARFYFSPGFIFHHTEKTTSRALDYYENEWLLTGYHHAPLFYCLGFSLGLRF